MFIQKQKNNCVENNTKLSLKKKWPFKILLIINNIFKIIFRDQYKNIIEIVFLLFIIQSTTLILN